MIPTSAPSPYRQQLVQLLLAVPIGETVSYAQMQDCVGFDIRQRRHLLFAALRDCNRVNGTCFAVIYKQGYRRLPFEHIPTVGSNIRRATRRRHRRSRWLMINALRLGQGNEAPSAETIRRVYHEINASALIEYLARDRVTGALPGKPVRSPLDVAKALRASVPKIAAKAAAA